MLALVLRDVRFLHRTSFLSRGHFSVRCTPASPDPFPLSPGAMGQSDPALVQQTLPVVPQPLQALPAGQQDGGMAQAQPGQGLPSQG
eukprot:8378369-Lingulodinium_polyedra.AAC.1